MHEVLLANPTGKPWCTGLAIAREAMAGPWPEGDLALSVTGLGVTPLLLAGGLQSSLDEIAAQKALAAFALTEPDAGSDAAALTTRAVRDGRGYQLHGVKRFISLGDEALFLTVFARTGEGNITAFLVRRAQPEIQTTMLENAGGEALYSIEFDGARTEAIVGLEGEGLRLALTTLGFFRASVGAQGIGIGRQALRLALARAASRRQFNRSIGSFGEVQSLLVESYLALLTARSVVRDAADRLDAGEEASQLSSAAKILGTEAGSRAADAAVAIFGGEGVLRDGPVFRLLERSRAPRIYEGANELQRHLVARWLLRQTDPLEEA